MKRLVKKAQKGNDQAFLQLFQHYEQDVYRMAYVYVKNQEDALDIVQEVAYQSYKKIDTLKQPEYIKTWLIRITINCATNLLRKNKKVVHLQTQHEKYMGTEEIDLSLSISLRDVMEKLEVDEKSIVLLRFYHHYTFQEVADLLDLPIGTAKTILYRALRKLRYELKESEWYEQ
ncbi:sigma-70 family RNA polymerase sigma factor [Halobacillus locisalis]|uniref:Sigma-70 family RNA polymerase sigma factor n=1 Tax=Halobacillus locisalis TaxID=220753 RepID=A0A838CRV0_9BACI|nr:sigma-70 family RNA polymerase sigma factor [Halobacillus locisalis]MBA2174862.1 sigma-70 family RNA polymerase sigma factor [Halobacillus locisalis]